MQLNFFRNLKDNNSSILEFYWLSTSQSNPELRLIEMKITRLINSTRKVDSTMQIVKSKLQLVTSKETIIVDKEKILFLKSSSNYCEIYLLDGTKLLCSAALKSIYQRLKMKNFCRFHSSYVINLHHLASVNSRFNSLTMIDGTEVPISRRHKNFLKEQMNKWFD